MSMKKVVSMLMAICMMLAIAPMDIVSATDKAIYKMDLTDCVPGSKDGQIPQVLNVKDGAGNKYASEDVTYGIQKNSVTVEKEPTVLKENGIKFLRFGHIQESVEGETVTRTWVNKNSSVNVKMRDTATSWGNADALTFETWVRERDSGVADSADLVRQNKSLFAFDAMRLYTQAAFAVQFNVDGSGMLSFSLYPDRTANNYAGDTTNHNTGINHGDIISEREKWAHYIVTREWVEGLDSLPNTEPDFADHWKSTIYLNGKLKNTEYIRNSTDVDGVTVYSDVVRQDYDTVYSSQTDQTDDTLVPYNYLIIGGDSYGEDRSFTGDIATFNIYSGVLDSAEAERKYLTSVGDFYLGLFGATLRNQNGTAITQENISSVTKVQVNDAVITNYSPDDEEPFVMLAVYNSDGALVKSAKLNATRSDANSSVIQIEGSIDGIEAGTINDAKLLIWNTPLDIKPLFAANTFSLVKERNIEKYKMTIPLADNLKPSSVKSENFRVYDTNTGDEIEITDTIYIPQTREVVLTLKPEGVLSSMCNIELSAEVSYIDGTSAETTYISEVMRNRLCGIFDVSVQEIGVYQDGSLTLTPDMTRAFTVKIRVVNTTYSDAVRELRVYLDDKIGIPIETRNITVKSGASEEYIFEVTEGLDADTAGTINVAVL